MGNENAFFFLNRTFFEIFVMVLDLIAHCNAMFLLMQYTSLTFIENYYF